MSSFFTAPSSQLKRKRPRKDGKRSPKGSGRQEVGGKREVNTLKIQDDESISGSDSDLSDPNFNESLHSFDEETSIEGDTAADRRRRLAEQYLENIRDEIDPVGFDAAEVDKDLIAQRLKEDVAESKGKAYRQIIKDLEFPATSSTKFRADQFCPTSVAVAYPFVYIAAKDNTVTMWQIRGEAPDTAKHDLQAKTPGKKPRLVKIFRGYTSRAGDPHYIGHTAPVMCCAVSSSGKYLATGGEDKKLVVWDAKLLKPLRCFKQHRDFVLAVCFRRNTHTLYSASADRTIKIWSLDEMSYVETLFGHEDRIVDVAGLARENCLSVGARDRTARLWKVAEESQLVFRGGITAHSADESSLSFAEGSIDHIAMLDEDTFVTGSDNGTISLWNTFRKKPLFSVPLAHGVDTIDEQDTKNGSSPLPSAQFRARWITALATVPYSDLILSGSWDGHIRVWKVSDDKKRIESVGFATAGQDVDSPKSQTALRPGLQGPIKGIINGISIFEHGDKAKNGVYALAVSSKEHRLGKWEKMHGARCEGILLEIRNVKTNNIDIKS